MLRPRALAGVLSQMNTGGVQSVMLFSHEGVLLAYTSYGDKDEKTTAAIAANVWNIYQKQLEATAEDLVQEIIINLADGKVVVTKLASVLLCLYGNKNVGLGMLRAKMQKLVQHLEEPLSLLSVDNN